MVVEKKVPVVMVEKDQARIYQLEDDLRFDTGSGVLSRKDTCVKLTSMPAKLLPGFLEAEKRRLSVNEIIELLWSGDAVDIARVYTIIKRLRKDLITISDWKIMNENGSYQLKIPIPSKNRAIIGVLEYSLTKPDKCVFCAMSDFVRLFIGWFLFFSCNFVSTS